jgi:hypothetical protein
VHLLVIDLYPNEKQNDHEPEQEQERDYDGQ